MMNCYSRMERMQSYGTGKWNRGDDKLNEPVRIQNLIGNMFIQLQVYNTKLAILVAPKKQSQYGGKDETDYYEHG